eukprot:scaffold191545_cov19-Tisochrysis_lutea.AAC.1
MPFISVEWLPLSELWCVIGQLTAGCDRAELSVLAARIHVHLMLWAIQSSPPNAYHVVHHILGVQMPIPICARCTGKGRFHQSAGCPDLQPQQRGKSYKVSEVFTWKFTLGCTIEVSKIE